MIKREILRRWKNWCLWNLKKHAKSWRDWGLKEWISKPSSKLSSNGKSSSKLGKSTITHVMKSTFLTLTLSTRATFVSLWEWDPYFPKISRLMVGLKSLSISFRERSQPLIPPSCRSKLRRAAHRSSTLTQCLTRHPTKTKFTLRCSTWSRASLMATTSVSLLTGRLGVVRRTPWAQRCQNRPVLTTKELFPGLSGKSSKRSRGKIRNQKMRRTSKVALVKLLTLICIYPSKRSI